MNTFCFLFISSLVHSQDIQYNLSASAILSKSNNFNLSLSVVPTQGIICINISGPDANWFGVGFGNTIMSDSYAIVCSKDTASSKPICQENKLGTATTSGYGKQLKRSITVISDSTNSQNIRTVHLKRNISIKIADYFSFPTWTQHINIIYAIGNSDSFTSSTTNMGPGGTTQLLIANRLTNNLTVSTTRLGAQITLNSIAIYADQDVIQLNITGPSDVYFGIGFNSTAMGPSTYTIICDISNCHENQLTGHSYGNSLTYTTKVVHNSTVNGQKTILLNRKRQITPVDTADFAKYFEFPTVASSIPVIYAIGGSGTWSEYNAMSLDIATYGSATIDILKPHNSSSGSLCKSGVVYYGTHGGVGNGFHIGLYIYCHLKTIQLSVDYSKYAPNWFGIVFNTMMAPSSNATVFTTGKPSENQRVAGLYSYDLGGEEASKVTYRRERDWKRLKQTENGNQISILYEQNLSNTKWSTDTTVITFRYAFGTSAQGTKLQRHTTSSYSDVWEFNLETGRISSSTSNIMQIAHGIIMVIAWSLLTSIAIFSSRYRTVLYRKANSRAMWFFVHRGIQSSVVVFVLVAFGVAIYFTQDNGELHFSNVHERIGLVVVILAILQPVNAWFRPHAAKQGRNRSVGRLLWEIIHKCSGYATWILAQIAIYFGIGQLTEKTIYKNIFIIWLAVIFALFVFLYVYDSLYSQKSQEIEKSQKRNAGQNYIAADQTFR